MHAPQHAIVATWLRVCLIVVLRDRVWNVASDLSADDRVAITAFVAGLRRILTI